jgi:hypothetical protein
MIQETYVNDDLKKFLSIVFDPKIQVSNIQYFTDERCELSYTYIDEEKKLAKNTNIAIASTTTAIARTKLYGAFERAGFDNILYCDTDSLIYTHPTGNDPIKNETQLGGLADDLEGATISEMIALAPKTYGYIRSDGKVVCKSKGFSLNAVVRETINLDSMKRMVFASFSKQSSHSTDRLQIAYPSRIRIDPRLKRLLSKDETKDFRFDFTKRKIDYINSSLDRITSIPY